MTTIIFANLDELDLHQSKSALQAIKPDWQVLTFTHGDEVLNCLSQKSADCVITDVKLQDMDGFDLLGKLQNLYPDIIRFTLTDNLEQEVVLESARANHRFINRATSSAVLARTIECSLRLHGVLRDEELQRQAGDISSLPSLPEIYQEMVNELTSPQSSLQQVARIIETDAALTASVLKIVNSSFYGLNQRVESVSQGVALLGVHLIKNVTLTAKVFSQFEGEHSDLNRLRILNDNANKTGALSNHFARLARVPRTVVDHTQMAGMLSNVGELMLLGKAQDPTSSDQGAQTQQLGANLQGAYLLRQWQLPDPVVEAVAFQCEQASSCVADLSAQRIIQAIRFLQTEFDDPKDAGQVSSCEDYLHACIDADLVEKWMNAYIDLFLLTAHNDLDSSMVA